MSDFHNKRLERFYISEEVPNNEGKLIQTLVGSTFKGQVIDSRDNYLVFMCPDFAEEDCEKGLETFTEVVENLNQMSNAKEINLKFGLIDVSKNEVDKEEDAEFPLIVLYRTDRKLEPTIYKGGQNDEEITGWIKVIEKKLN